MILQKFIKAVREINPQCLYDIAHLDTITYIGEGAFRYVFSFGKLPIVVKFPIPDRGKRTLKSSLKESIEHSVDEIGAFETISKNHPKIRKYLPKIYYYNRYTGVVVMRKYLNVDDFMVDECHKIGQEIRKEMNIKDWDYGSNNFGIDPVTMSIKVVDLGLLLDGYEYYGQGDPSDSK